MDHKGSYLEGMKSLPTFVGYMYFLDVLLKKNVWEKRKI